MLEMLDKIRLRYYDKFIDDLSNKEKKLLEVDNSIIKSTFPNAQYQQLSDSKIISIGIKFSDLVEKKRIKLVCELLKIDMDYYEIHELLELIEESKYSLSNFLRDTYENNVKILNLKRWELLN